MWLDEDANYVMALERYEAGQCPGCGHQRSETWNAELQSQWVAQSEVCYACDAIDRRRKALADGNGPGIGGVSIWVDKD